VRADVLAIEDPAQRRWVSQAIDAAVARRVAEAIGDGALLPPVLAVHPGATALVFDLVRCADGAARTTAWPPTT
jgi:hypothetical protein